MSCRCQDPQRSGMHLVAPRARPPPAPRSTLALSPWSRSFRRCPTIRADRRVRARAEPRDTRTGNLARRRLKMAALDALNRGHHRGPAALEVFGAERPLAIFLQAR